MRWRALKEGHSPDEVFASQPVSIPFTATIEREDGTPVGPTWAVFTAEEAHELATAIIYYVDAVAETAGEDSATEDKLALGVALGGGAAGST